MFAFFFIPLLFLISPSMIEFLALIMVLIFPQRIFEIIAIYVLFFPFLMILREY